MEGLIFGILRYVAKNWALAMIQKTLPLAHFSMVLLLKERMIISVKKRNVKNAGQIIAKPNRFLAKFVQKIPTKLAIFYRLFLSKVYPENFHENLTKSANFSMNLSLKIPQNLTFFCAIYQKPCIRHGQAVFFLFFWGKKGKR